MRKVLLISALLALPAFAQDRVAFVKQAKETLTRDFKDPSSVQYRGVFISNRGYDVLCGEVNAKNSYGAYVGFKRFYIADGAITAALESPNSAAFMAAKWDEMCGAVVQSVD